MQLIEYGLWMHPVCDGWNRALSYGGMLLNHAQPIVLAGLVYAFSKQQVSKLLLFTVMAVYTLWMIQYSLEFGKAATPEGTCTSREPGNPHLIWHWNQLPNSGYFYGAFLTVILLLSLVGLTKPFNYWMAGITGLLFTISREIYGKKQATGALWCFLLRFFLQAYGCSHNELHSLSFMDPMLAAIASAAAIAFCFACFFIQKCFQKAGVP